MPTLGEIVAMLGQNGMPMSYAPSGSPAEAPPYAAQGAPFEDQRELQDIMQTSQFPPTSIGQAYAASGPPSAAPRYAVASAPFDDQREMQGYMTAPRAGQSIAERQKQLSELGLSPRQIAMRLAHEGAIDPRYAEMAAREPSGGGL